MATKAKPQPLEDKLKRLEEVAALLDRGDASIDEQLAMYEEGMRLAQECRTYLEEAELKVRRLSGEPDESDD
jgi:exodeoxyribonuclease VII small subunit